MTLELLAYAITLGGASAAVLIVLYATKIRKKEQVLQTMPMLSASERWQHRVRRSIPFESAKEAGEELRTLTLEREILSDAIRRLYEAHAEGRITEREREQLAETYKSRMMKIKEAISENESIVALHELEAMQEDLTKLFDERFEELNTKIEALRSRIGLEAKEAIVPTSVVMPPQMEKPVEKTAAMKARKGVSRKPQKPKKKPAEERLERIRAEVEKVLDRLEQMEAEP